MGQLGLETNEEGWALSLSLKSFFFPSIDFEFIRRKRGF
jgi:hypothetical protein